MAYIPVLSSKTKPFLSSVLSVALTKNQLYKEFDNYLKLAENSDLKVIFLNTTEAGIEYIPEDKLSDTPAKAFPAKLTQWLFHRFKHFNGASSSGMIIIPCELIDYNGEKFKEIVLQYSQLWDLPV